MGILAVSADERVKDVRTGGDALIVDLMDGRTITVPLAWFPRLAGATAEQLANWETAGAGYGIHWPDLDEDLSTEGLLRGAPAAASHTKSAVVSLSTVTSGSVSAMAFSNAPSTVPSR